ncbi:lysostaphin resistance A-like protein [Leifsonia poae]|uniref:CPBP family intramembrane glutamic endopeptidase n=1 Tax=Leifsonia poae TaxID=110933 RepID=UPI003D67F63A
MSEAIAPTTTSIRPIADKDRFGRQLERRDGVDFPYYNGVPVTIGVWQWVAVWAACLAGLLALMFIPTPGNILALIPRFLFLAIPLAVLILVAGRYWKAIFRKVTGWDVLNMFFFWGLNFVVTSLAGVIVKAFFPVAGNAAANTLGKDGVPDAIAFYIGTGIQLVGEEVFTILPFLALMYFFFAKAKFSRKTAIILAWLISAVWFGAAHLPTYDWNVAQAFIIIGVARLVLTLAFIRTKNLWVSSGAHILNDWSTFTFVLVSNLAH